MSQKASNSSANEAVEENRSPSSGLPSYEYFRIRDFEYVQPLYDLAFLLEVGSLAKGSDVPKYRTFSLWRAGYSMDGYGTNIDRWLDGSAADSDLDYVPSSRIRQYLEKIRKTGTIPELREYRSERFARCLRLRSVRGLGPSQIALTVSSSSLRDDWFDHAAINLSLQRDRITDLYDGHHNGPWQTAHVVPPLLRFLFAVQKAYGKSVSWTITGITDPFEAITQQIIVFARIPANSLKAVIADALKQEKLFRRDTQQNADGYKIKHQMGWSFSVQPTSQKNDGKTILDLMQLLDPLGLNHAPELIADLHLHTAWSDGSASVNSMATAVVGRGLKYFAVTDHSRSCKLQGGLTDRKSTRLNSSH